LAPPDLPSFPTRRSSDLLFGRMLAALSRQFGIPLDVPFERLDPKHQRSVLFGTGEKWLDLNLDLAPKSDLAPKIDIPPKPAAVRDRKSTRLNSSHVAISY